ncbi:MAG: hypothetical protein ACT4P6_19175 [Gemmatimonadaceae bacterium]
MSKQRPFALLAVLFTAAACSEGVGPNDRSFDAQNVKAGLAVIERVASAKVLASLHAVSRSVSDVGAATPLSSTSWSPALEQVVLKLSTSAAQAGTALIPVMRSSVLGKTFVWDPSVRKYVPDPARTGAPANGVRFILYDVDPNENPLAGAEIGYADLTDERRSAAATAGVRLEVVTGGVTRLAYSFDLTGSLEKAQFDVFGYITDGSDRLDFSIKTSQQLFGRGGKATLDAKLFVAQEDVEVTAKIAGIAGEENGDGEIDLTIRSKLDEIVVDAETVRGQLAATFSVNGQLLATATGDPKAPVLRGDGGRELTDEETQAVVAIVAMAGGVFTFVSQLLQPAGVLLLIALGSAGSGI